MRVFTGKSQVERLSFFSDAVIAIAITLLVLELRLEETEISELTFSHLWDIFPKFASCLFSFIIVAVVWNIRYELDQLVKKVDQRLVWATFVWLFFIITLPFSASLVSTYFAQKVSTFIYSINVLCIALSLNYIWDYMDRRPEFLNEFADHQIRQAFRVSCNVGVVNGIVAVIFSFFAPQLSFAILLLRPVTTYLVKSYYRFRRNKR